MSALCRSLERVLTRNLSQDKLERLKYTSAKRRLPPELLATVAAVAVVAALSGTQITYNTRRNARFTPPLYKRSEHEQKVPVCQGEMSPEFALLPYYSFNMFHTEANGTVQ